MLALYTTTAVGIGQIALAYPTMPAEVVSHFDAAGQANGWSTRAEFSTQMIALHLAMAAMFGFIGWMLPKLPDSLINIRNKEVWLAPARRAETLAWTADWMRWMGVLTQLLMCAIVRISLAASGDNPQPMPTWTPWVLLAAFLSLTAIWLVGFFRRFARKPA